MPIYEYVCKKCAKEFEQLVDNPTRKVKCACGSGRTERKLSVFSAGSSDPGRHCPARNQCPGSGSSCGGCCGAQ